MEPSYGRAYGKFYIRNKEGIWATAANYNLAALYCDMDLWRCVWEYYITDEYGNDRQGENGDDTNVKGTISIGNTGKLVLYCSTALTIDITQSREIILTQNIIANILHHYACLPMMSTEDAERRVCMPEMEVLVSTSRGGGGCRQSSLPHLIYDEFDKM